MKTNIVIDISPSYLAKFWVSSYGPKCCQPVKLQDCLNCNILRKKWMRSLFFVSIEVNIKVFYKLIPSFWMSVTRHNQITQSKFSYLCNISPKAWGMKLMFCLQINIQAFYWMIASLWVSVASRDLSKQFWCPIDGTKNLTLIEFWNSIFLKL